MDRPVRVLLDVNIFVGNLMAHDLGHEGTATQTLVSMVSGQQWGLADRAQLIISFEMIETLETVLHRLKYPGDRIKAYTESIVDIARYGPDELDPISFWVEKSASPFLTLKMQVSWRLPLVLRPISS